MAPVYRKSKKNNNVKFNAEVDQDHSLLELVFANVISKLILTKYAILNANKLCRNNRWDQMDNFQCMTL
jgi:hypothetical protein